MRLRPDQLSGHLARQLAAVYLIYGEELLLLQEAGDAIRAAARHQGYGERECFTVETGFDWNSVSQTAASPSLFASRRLLDLRLGTTRPGDTGSRVLTAYAARPPADAVLLVSAGKLDAEAQKSRWFQALDAAGVVVPIRPVAAAELPGWIERRLRGVGLQPAPEAVTLLAERVAGNLLAAAQEIAKLQLLYPSGPLSLDQVLSAVSDSARYSVYDLVDTALAGQAARTARVLAGLTSEGVDPVLILWALHREIRSLAGLAFARDHGQPLEAALAKQGVWEKRKPLVRQALNRLATLECRRLLGECAQVERVLKGAESGDVGAALLRLGLHLAGQAGLARLADSAVVSS